MGLDNQRHEGKYVLPADHVSIKVGDVTDALLALNEQIEGVEDEDVNNLLDGLTGEQRAIFNGSSLKDDASRALQQDKMLVVAAYAKLPQKEKDTILEFIRVSSLDRNLVAEVKEQAKKNPIYFPGVHDLGGVVSRVRNIEDLRRFNMLHGGQPTVS